MLVSLPPVVRRRRVRSLQSVRSTSQSPLRSSPLSSVVANSSDSVMAQNPVDIADMLMSLQRSIEALNHTVAAQAETIARLQHPSGAFTAHLPPINHPVPNPPPPIKDPQGPNLPEDLRVPVLPVEGIPIQLVGGFLVQPFEGLFSFDPNDDPAMLKLAKLKKLFKNSQGINSIPDIEDKYTETVVRLPERFNVDRFDGSGDPMVYIRLFLDVLKPMGLTRAQKLSLFGRTLSGVAVIWYVKLEDLVKQSWDELAEAFITQYSYNMQIEITTGKLTRQEPNESFVAFITRWRAKAAMMTNRPLEKD